ncbi:MAG: FHA domain-containing serine/threonine-protein kinase [bacterium]
MIQLTLEIIGGLQQDRGQKLTICCEGPDNVTAGRASQSSEQSDSRQPHFQISAHDPHLSRWHFMILIRPPHCFICDLGSTNGTYVNDFEMGKFIEGERELHDGDEILAGKTRLRVHLIASCPEQPHVLRCHTCGQELPEIAQKSAAEIQANDFYCASCRAPSPEEYVLATIRDTTQTLLIQRSALTCFACGTNVSERADNDGRAAEFRTCALYYCEACAQKHRKDDQQVGDYLILTKIGEGGKGIVFQAWHPLTGRIVAIKEILPDHLLDDKALLIFQREISVSRDLVHPHIVRFYDSFTEKRKPYLVTEFLSNGSVADRLIRRLNPLPAEEAYRIIADALEGLAYAHARGIVHRDVKLDNFLISRDETIKLSDLGLAKSYEQAGQSGITGAGDIGGTIPFLAPEQICNYRFVKPSADVYSVGVSLYVLLTRSYPYPLPKRERRALSNLGTDRIRVFHKTILDSDPIPIQRLRSQVPAALAAVIHRCLCKNPEDRYKDAAELQEALGEAMHGNR